MTPQPPLQCLNGMMQPWIGMRLVHLLINGAVLLIYMWQTYSVPAALLLSVSDDVVSGGGLGISSWQARQTTWILFQRMDFGPYFGCACVCYPVAHVSARFQPCPFNTFWFVQGEVPTFSFFWIPERGLKNGGKCAPFSPQIFGPKIEVWVGTSNLFSPKGRQLKI